MTSLQEKTFCKSAFFRSSNGATRENFLRSIKKSSKRAIIKVVRVWFVGHSQDLFLERQY